MCQVQSVTTCVLLAIYCGGSVSPLFADRSVHPARAGGEANVARSVPASNRGCYSAVWAMPSGAGGSVGALSQRILLGGLYFCAVSAARSTGPEQFPGKGVGQPGLIELVAPAPTEDQQVVDRQRA